ncbi:hypothetical protein Bca52824_035895 [Brassica carinata]|uniref:Uncharacterized protein n=1 Tax=Brassica carinata TaxID=52824 RepID=A0A8X7S1N1_BRACI|nr:hypothetical protein Bca52824_035895 [Brassica carinata]
MEENPMFVAVPFQQVLQMNFDNTYSIDLLGCVNIFGTLIESVDDPYEEMFGEEFWSQTEDNVLHSNSIQY